MDKASKIYLAGHRGLVGSAIHRLLISHGYSNLVVRTHQELDLTDPVAVRSFFEQERPEFVIIAAAKVGGILANNTYPVDFIQQNLMIEVNIISEAWRARVKRLLLLGSNCIYPKECPQPIREEFLMTGHLEITNRPYAIAKIAGIELCSAYNRQFGTNFLTTMPPNMFGPNDHYDLQTCHLLPALIRKMHEAKVAKKDHVIVWGTGTPRRECLFSEDLADACIFLMNLPEQQFEGLVKDVVFPLINVGAGIDSTIEEIAKTVARVVGFQGQLIFDPSKPDGTMRKLLDSSRIKALGWKGGRAFEEGIKTTYQFVLENEEWAKQ